MKFFLCAMFALGALAGASARADVLVFDNGDRLTGTLVGQSADTIHFQSATLGVLTVPTVHAHVETAKPAGTQDKAAATAQNSPTWADAAKHLINWAIPGEISGRLDAGLTSTRSNATTTQVISVGNLTIKDAPNTYDFKGFYYYTATRAADGTVSRSADRYGASAAYRRDLDARLFVTDEGDYLRDFQANIQHQAQDTLTGGYVLWKSDRANLAVQAGPTQRYIDADGLGVKWRTLGSGRETLKFKLTNSLRLEQDSNAVGQLDEIDNHSWAVSAALINQLDRNLELALRYSQSYNTIVGVNGARSEQVVALTLGVTF